MEYLKRFSYWSTSEDLKLSSKALEDSKHSYIDTIACILAGQKHPISDKIKKYNGETVTIMGYMFPLEESEKQRKFLIGPYPLSCPFHYHVGPSQVIEIKSDNPVDFSFDPITIKGKLKIKFNEETGSFFYLETIKS